METDITLKEAQTKVDEWIKTVGVRYFNELTNLGILMEEVGELSRLMVRKYGEQSFKESDKKPPLPGEVGGGLSDEMADVLWVLICLANQTGVDLTEALQKNFDKKNKRDANRHKENEKLK
jgi:NTP pyrophosphatase (non-canonical NTP hydrolase)